MAFGMGCAVTFVVTLAGTLTWIIDHVFLMRYPAGSDAVSVLYPGDRRGGAVGGDVCAKILPAAVRKLWRLPAADHDQLCDS